MAIERLTIEAPRAAGASLAIAAGLFQPMRVEASDVRLALGLDAPALVLCSAKEEAIGGRFALSRFARFRFTGAA